MDHPTPTHISRIHLALLVGLVLGITVTACSSDKASSPTTAAVTTVAGVAVTAVPADTTAPIPAESSADPAAPATQPDSTSPIDFNPDGDKLMPDVVCLDLQAAQDVIQNHGVFFSKSVDASGEDRMQIVDSNWIVVSQTPAAGTPVGEAEAILSVVKDTEANPC